MDGRFILADDFIIGNGISFQGSSHGKLSKINFLDFDVYYGSRCIIKEIDGAIIVLSGHLLNCSIEFLSEIVCGDIKGLNALEGHFCGVLLRINNTALAFSDRYGARTVFLDTSDNDQLYYSSSIYALRYRLKRDSTVEKKVLREQLYYRINPGKETLVKGIEKIPAYHYTVVSADNIIEHIKFWDWGSAGNSLKSPIASVEFVKTEIVENLKRLSKEQSSVAVLLSGGVDSFILAALAKDAFESTTLYTPIWDGNNPELATAKEFARLLDLPHQLVHVDSESILTSLEDVLTVQQEPLRNFSSLVLHYLMRKIPPEQSLVLYGQAADTLFGSDEIKHVFQNNLYRRIASFIPKILLSKLASISSKFSLLQELAESSEEEIIDSLSLLSLGKASTKIANRMTSQSGVKVKRMAAEFSLEGSTIDSAKRFEANTTWVSHLKEIETAARLNEKSIASPFQTPVFQELSSRLSYANYFGSLLAAYLPAGMYTGKRQVKPLLRKLALQYAPYNLIYQKKEGFPVPKIQWMQEGLSERIERTVQKTIRNNNESTELSLEKDFELIWTLMSLDMIGLEISDDIDLDLKKSSKPYE